MLLILGLIILASVFFIQRYHKNKRFWKLCDQLPGPPTLPLIGNGYDFAGLDNEASFWKGMQYSYNYGRMFRVWFKGNCYIILKEPKDIEVLLTDTKNLTKSDLYKVFLPWIGYGLLTSAGERWRNKRKAITPSFHFTSLDSFFEVFNKNGQIMRDCLEKELGKEPFDIYHYVNRAAFDNICETAMGVPYNVQLSLDSAYMKAVKTICRTATPRLIKPWLLIDAIFNRTSMGKEQKEAIEYIDKSTMQLIEKRRKVIESRKQKSPEEQDEFRKEKLTFLDMLLEAEGTRFTNEEIRDEINTFMFEGHDTVSSSSSFALYALANHPEVQEKVYQELIEVLGEDGAVTMAKIGELKYLNKVAKETIRLYPPSAFIGRTLEDDLKLHDGSILPKGADIIINIYALHHDPKFWPNPERFNPENFEGDTTPFSFIPFSAGPRNCIGQKFALLEMKTIISYVVRKYKLSPSPNPRHKLRVTSEMVVISKSGQHICIEERKKSL